jgi:hypothetical protein
MGVWQEVAMDSLKFHPDPLCPTLPCHMGGPPLKWLYGHFRGDPPAGRVACGAIFYPFGHPTSYTYAIGHGPIPHLRLIPNFTFDHRRLSNSLGEFHHQGDNVEKQYY